MSTSTQTPDASTSAALGGRGSRRPNDKAWVAKGPKQPLVAQSETAFSGTGLMYRFLRDSHGDATHIIEGHVSGDYTYERQK